MTWPAARGMDSRVPVPRAVEGAETRRDSPDPGGGAARSGAALGVTGRDSPDPRGGAVRSGAALGVTLFQDAAPCGLQQDSARGPGDLSSQRWLSTQLMWKNQLRTMPGSPPATSGSHT